MRGPRSRREVLAAAGAAVLVAGCGTKATPANEPKARVADSPGDREILAFALTLEYFESAFYKRLASERILKGDDQAMVKRIARNEAAHVDALEKMLERLGGEAPERPRPNFDLLLSGGSEAVLRRAADIENVGPAAYLGQAPMIQNERVLAAALSIHTIEARQAALLNRRVGRAFTPNGALAVPLNRNEVMAQVGRFLA